MYIFKIENGKKQFERIVNSRHDVKEQEVLKTCSDEPKTITSTMFLSREYTQIWQTSSNR